jgi:DNA-binding transcriptional LysR family regulator
VELYQLRSFVAVAQAGHLTRAAEKLHLSQPAVSSQIKALEDELELPLFARTSSGMVLTAAGMRLLGDANKILAAAQTMRNNANALRGEIAGAARVGTLSDPDFIRVGEFLNATVERHPLLQVELHHVVSGAALDKVRDGEFDGSFYFGDLAQPGIGGLGLRSVSYRIAAPAAWCSRVAGASWAEIANLPWVITPAISTHHHLVQALFDKHGIEPTKVVEADQEFVIANLVEAGVGLSLIREELALQMQAANEVCLWGEVRLDTTLWFIYAQEREHDPVIRALLQVLVDTWKLRESNPRISSQIDGQSTRSSA